MPRQDGARMPQRTGNWDYDDPEEPPVSRRRDGRSAPPRGGSARRPNGPGGGSRLALAWRQRSGKARAGYIIATMVAVIAMVGGLAGYTEVRRLEGNITKVKVGGL